MTAFFPKRVDKDLLYRTGNGCGYGDLEGDRGANMIKLVEILHVDKINNTLEDVKLLLSEYEKSLNIDLSFQSFNEEMDDLLKKYGPPDGSLILIKADGIAAGCVAMRKLTEKVCEMKRLYVCDKFKGLGIGRKLVTIIIEEAQDKGYTFMRLDTLPEMKGAQYLYEDFGFYDIKPYVYNPIANARFMELKLKD